MKSKMTQIKLKAQRQALLAEIFSEENSLVPDAARIARLNAKLKEIQDKIKS